MKGIIIFGPPGAGKGTQSELLCKKLDLIHFSTGEELRKEVARKTTLGKKINSLISKGNFVSDELSTKITKKFILKNKNTRKKGILLDGFPRTLSQASELLKILEKLKVSSISVINLDLDEEEIIKRLLLRAKIEKRADDNLATIKDRLHVYYSQTKPILNFFKSENVKIFDFNGKGNIKKINKEIIEKLPSRITT